MEIRTSCTKNHATEKFKIDLIVWKFGGQNLVKGQIGVFKIDLIVWKYVGNVIA